MEIASIIDQELASPHGNRKGLSYGQLSVLFLSYVVSQSDHRLCAVEAWVEKHRQTLKMATGWTIGEKDATDDRLADLLSIIGSSQPQEKENIALRLGQKTIRAYELPTDKARSDTTSFSVYHQPRTESENLLNFGYSKDHRPDLVQYRQMLATLDPMGLPLLGETLPGNKTDESDYLPTWRQLAKIIGHKDFLFLADSKASTWKNRALINQQEGAGRGGENRAFRRVRQTTFSLTYQRCQATISEQQSIAGWRLYATNAKESRLSVEQAVNSYREQWQPERGFHRFKRGRLPALPIYFQDEERIRGLMFLLTIALTLFTLMEFVVRRQLAVAEQSLSGLYSGNPKRTTNHPTAEQMLTAFGDLTLYLYPDGSTEITSLNSLQRQILLLMKIPESIYFVPQLVPN